MRPLAELWLHSFCPCSGRQAVDDHFLFGFPERQVLIRIKDPVVTMEIK